MCWNRCVVNEFADSGVGAAQLGMFSVCFGLSLILVAAPELW